ncbi:Ectonucleoside triphosphate diphosphohydrolase 6 [Sciurus carolinensis]|uniref:nucleoside diphosphate phosphatase n=1 Tax=Sciurus carolinensis TaxID=30640 RepID=A0AA41SU60_SCICA|nr:Ectonucleoside triphosphate diphosphohydrolase 6 [Sciurus carolinensis]
MFPSGTCFSPSDFCSQDCNSGVKPGFPKRIKTDDPGVLKAARHSVEKFNNCTNDIFLFKESYISRALVQVVKGLKYMLEVKIGRTTCRKTTHHPLDNCDFQTNPDLKRMRKIPNHGTLRMTKVAYPLGLCLGLFIYVVYIKWHRASATQAFFTVAGAASGARWGQQARSSLGSATRGHEVFYGIMFDAGSTGTRVHVFQFAQPPGETPTLTHETFKALKPGLSAYADDVEKSAQGIQELLDVAKQEIPFDFWKVTPLVLKATAGLRLLPGEKAQKLLQKMGGCIEGQPYPGHYFHSYLGLGLMSARLAILGGVEGKPVKDGKELVSPCLSPGFKGEWEHAEITYRISGQKAGSLHELCASRVSEVLRNKVHRTKEVEHVDFYAFSYYYDLAASVGLIDAEKGGSLVVGDFEIAAKYVCRTLETQPHSSPFVCMDLTYITLLLQEFGFPRDKVLKLTRKIDNVETSWALGAIFHYIDSLNREKSPAL